MPGLRLNYDVKIGPIEARPYRRKNVGARQGRAEMQGSIVPLGRNHVSPSGAPSHRRALRIVLAFFFTKNKTRFWKSIST